jgi:hypothetical protein
MSVVVLDVMPQDDPLGTPVLTLTDEDIEDFELRVGENDLGSCTFSINRHHALLEAAVTDPLIAGSHVQVTFPAIDTDPVFSFWLDEHFDTVLAIDEEGGELLQRGGPGTLAILQNALLLKEFYDPTQGARGDISIDPYWTWIQEPHGAILVRGISEGQNEPGLPLADVTIDFTRTVDSDGALWPELGEEKKIQVRWGISVLDLYRRVVAGGDLHVRARPNLLIQAYMARGVDRTSASFAAGKVRLVKGVNIDTELTRQAHGTRAADHAFVMGKDDVVVTSAAAPPFGRGRWIAVDYGVSDDTALLSSVGVEALRRSTAALSALEFELHLGDDPSVGLYLPWKHFDTGDLVTLHTGTAAFDFNESDRHVTGWRITLQPATDDSTAEQAAASLRCVLEIDAGQSSDGTSTGQLGIAPIGSDHTHDLPLCEPSRGWTLPIEFLIKQRIENVHDNAAREFAIRARDGIINYPFCRVNWYYDLAADALQLYCQGQDQNANATPFPVAVEALTAPDGVEFFVRFRIETTEVKAKLWNAAGAEPGAWMVTASGGGYTLSALGASTFNRLEDIFESQFPSPASFFQDYVKITAGFGPAVLTDDFLTAAAGDWGPSTINGETWETESSVNAGVSGGYAFWTAASLETGMSSQLIIPSEEDNCPQHIGLVCSSGTSTDAARCDHVHTAAAADVSYSGGGTVEDALQASLATAGSFTTMAKWSTD